MSTTDAPVPPTRRWALVALLAAATFINYLDRGSLAVALPAISKEFRLTTEQQGLVLSSFFWAYTLMQIPMGWVVDRYDIRKVYAIAFTLWSLAAAGTGLARGLGDLLFFRVLLGLGESVYLPGGMKVVSLNFRAEESTSPVGLFDLGGKVGLAVGTSIDVWLLVHFGWRNLFFRTGLAGLIWVGPWLLSTRSAPVRKTALPRIQWSALVANRTLLAICLGFFCWDYFWYFLISWLPSYLLNIRHVSLPNVGVFGAVPFLVFAISEWIGAWGTRVLVARGWNLSLVIKSMIAVGFSFGLFVIPAALVQSSTASIAFILAASLSGLSVGNLLAIPRICAPDDQVALWSSVQNFVGNLAGVLAPLVTAYLIARTDSYASSFLLAAGVLILGIVAYVVLIPDLNRFLTRASDPR